MATKLMPLRPSGSALRSLSRRRPSQRVFSTTPATASLSPQSKSNKKIASEPTRRSQATVAAPAPYECLPPLVLCLNSIRIDYGKPDKQDQYPAPLSIRTSEGMMSRLSRIARCQKWTNREIAGLCCVVHVLTVYTALLVLVAVRYFTR